jgi:DNA modification methylase
VRKFQLGNPILLKSEATIEIVNASAQSIPLRSEAVTLTVTSPPYHNAIDYNKHLNSKEWYRGNLGSSLEAYLESMEQSFLEILRVTKKSGFCCIVIGNELTNGTITPLPHIITNLLCSNDRWRFHEEIIWNKVTGGLDRFGVTIQSPFPTYYRANIMHEQILVLRKGDLEHTKDKNSKLTIDEVMKRDVSNSIWNIPPVPPKYIEHPCPFPEEIPLRLISLYSNRGDLVLDPFVGSGQTGKAAKYLGREFFGIDLQFKYCRLARDRIKSEELHVRAPLVPKWERIESSKLGTGI